MDPILDPLNSPQREAVTLPPDRHGAILAGAGTGKTRVLVHRMAHLIDQGIHPSRITAVTFTNKASKEMRERISTMVPNEQAQALRMGTFHSIGLKLLRRYGNFLGYRKAETIRPLDTEDACVLLRRVFKETLSLVEQECIKPSEALEIITSWKDAGPEPHDIPPQVHPKYQLAASLYAPYEREKTRSNAVDFADMILMPVRLLKARPEIAQRMHHGLSQILVDEFQDTNPLQMQLVDLLTDSGRAVPTFVVGDDDQSIYSWRGADANIFQIFLKRYHDVHLVRLEQNYRCNSLILEAANSVIAHNAQRIGKVLFTENTQTDFLQQHSFRDAESEAEGIASEISAHLKAGDSPDQTAILYRKNKFSRLLEHALLRHQIPYRIYGGTAFYARKEIKDVLAYLRLVHDPADNEAFQRAASVPPKGFGAKALAGLHEFANQHRLSLYDAAMRQQPKALTGLLDLTQNLTAQYQEHGLAHLVHCTVRQTGLSAYYIQREKEKGEERAENLEELVTAALAFHHEFHMGETTDGSLAPKPGDPLSEFLTEAVLDSEGAKQSNRKPAVQLMTVHKAKGLEFDRVYVAALEEGEFPSAKAAETPEGLEEERRLFYVALTRARHYLHLSYAHFRVRFNADALNGLVGPSMFLDEIPPNLFEHPLQDANPRQRLEPARKSLSGPSGSTTRALPESASSDLW